MGKFFLYLATHRWQLRCMLFLGISSPISVIRHNDFCYFLGSMVVRGMFPKCTLVYRRWESETKEHFASFSSLTSSIVPPLKIQRALCHLNKNLDFSSEPYKGKNFTFLFEFCFQFLICINILCSELFLHCVLVLQLLVSCSTCLMWSIWDRDGFGVWFSLVMGFDFVFCFLFLGFADYQAYMLCIF